MVICYCEKHPLFAKLISTFEVEKAESHLMDLINPDEKYAEDSIGQRCIPFNKVDPTVPKEIKVTFYKQLN